MEELDNDEEEDFVRSAKVNVAMHKFSEITGRKVKLTPQKVICLPTTIGR